MDPIPADPDLSPPPEPDMIAPDPVQPPLIDFQWLRVWAPVAVIIQLGMIVHVIRTGRPYHWIWLLLAFPGLAGIIYFMTEIWPDISTRRGIRSIGRIFQTRRRRIARLQKDMEDLDTPEMRLELAELLLEERKPQAALDAVEECLTGSLATDAHVVETAARARVELGQAEEALALLNREGLEPDIMARPRLDILRARCLEAKGQGAAAEGIYRRVSLKFPGDEPRSRLANLLEAGGQREEARALAEDVMRKFRKGNSRWRRSERPWYESARALVKRLDGKT